MEQEDKELLLRDLCVRLPYGVKFPSVERSETVLFIDTSDNEVWINGTNINDVKPYLFPLSSMTEDQRELRDEILDSYNSMEQCYIKLIDWYNKNHFDYMNLIPKGLAIDCTNLNIY